MIPLATSQQMTRIDSEAQESFGIPGILLMEQAGVKGFHRCVQKYQDRMHRDSRFVFIAGGGNNGGDALVMAREASVWGADHVSVVLTSTRINSNVTLHRDICAKMEIPLYSWQHDRSKAEAAVRDAEVLVDGIAGTGLTGPLRGNAEEAVRFIASLTSRPFIISIDLASGIAPQVSTADAVIAADCTVTMGTPKVTAFLPHVRLFSGDIITVNPGFPRTLLSREAVSACLLKPEDAFLPPIALDAYKNTRGHAAVFAGSVGYTGAARLSSQSAASTRTGLVTLYCDEELYEVCASSVWESVIVRPVSHRRDAMRGVTSILAGPGWGRSSERSELLSELIEHGIPGVIDADGIHALAKLISSGKLPEGALDGRWVITPHPGEFRALQPGVTDGTLLEKLSAFTQNHRCWIVYKTHVTILSGPMGECWIADEANPALGKAGSGDVLSGIITGLLAEGLDPGRAAMIGVLVHQSIGRRAFSEFGWFTPDRLYPLISRELQDITRWNEIP